MAVVVIVMVMKGERRGGMQWCRGGEDGGKGGDYGDGGEVRATW